jgi:hypothetical protein
MLPTFHVEKLVSYHIPMRCYNTQCCNFYNEDVNIRFDAFPASEYNEVFSDYQRKLHYKMFIICTVHLTFLRLLNQRGRDGQDM